MFLLIPFVLAITAGSVAAVAGFGIGSLLTPYLALHYPIKVAVAAIAVPHFLATALLASVAGNPVLTIVFGAAVTLAALLELSGLARRLRFSGPVAWLAGAASGFLGGTWPPLVRCWRCRVPAS